MQTYLGKAKYILKVEDTFVRDAGQWYYIMDRGGAMLVKIPMTSDQAAMASDEMGLEVISPATYLSIMKEKDSN